MHNWITDRPHKKRRWRNTDQPRLELPLPLPIEREETRGKAEGEVDDEVPRGIAEVDFYI